MQKASLRRPGKAPEAPVIDAEVVKETPKPTAATTGAAVSSGTLEDLAASGTQEAPPATNDNVKEGCEQFSEPPTTAVARRATNTAVSVPRDASLAESGFEGDWDTSDLKFPALKQVQGDGPLSQLFDNGTIVYGDVELLPPPSVKEGVKNPVLRIIPMHIFKQFREKLSEDAVKAGEMPRIFNSKREVEEAGLTTVWIGDERPDNFAEPSARMTLLIEKPEGSDHPLFALEFGGKQYGVAVYYAAGGSYRDSAKVIYNNAKTSLLVPVVGEDGQPVRQEKTGLIIKKPLMCKHFWTMGFAKKKAGNFNPWRPVVKLQAEQTSAEIRAYIAELLSSAPAEASDE